MALPLIADSDTVAVGVTVVATVVVLALVAAVVLLLAAVRQLRGQAEALSREAGQLLDEMSHAVRQAGLEVERVDRMVGSAEAISDAVGGASRLVGGAVARPFIKVVAFGSGLLRGARLVRSGAPVASVLPATGPRRRGKARSQRVARSARGAPGGAPLSKTGGNGAGAKRKAG